MITSVINSPATVGLIFVRLLGAILDIEARQKRDGTLHMRPVNHESPNTTPPCGFRGNESMGSANKAVINDSGVFVHG